MCWSEWPTFKVGWPWEGTFDLSVVVAIQSKVFREAEETRNHRLDGRDPNLRKTNVHTIRSKAIGLWNVPTKRKEKKNIGDRLETSLCLPSPEFWPGRKDQ